jgi:ribonuclease BN (tRNA processing enzyme)
MKRFGVDPSRILTVLLSHLHGDHFGGVPFLVLDGQFSKRTDPLIVGGPPGTKVRIHEAMETLFPGSSSVERRFDLEVTDLEPGIETKIGDLIVLPFEVPHASGAPALALRVGCEDRVVAYSGDCEWSDVLLDVARDADLFICEAYFHDKRVPWHLDYATLASHLPELSCRRLVLTHMSVDMLDRGSGVELERATDGMTIHL